MPLYQREAAGIRLIDVHRTWEDYAGIILGVLIGLSPWLTGGDEKPLAIGNAFAVGVMIFALAAFELVDLNRSEEVGEIVLALWLIASPPEHQDALRAEGQKVIVDASTLVRKEAIQCDSKCITTFDKHICDSIAEEANTLKSCRRFCAEANPSHSDVRYWRQSGLSAFGRKTDIARIRLDVRS